MLTPSSNTVLEPITSAMVAGLEGVSAHFGRFRVTEISLTENALDQFDNAPLIEASRMLADARQNLERLAKGSARYAEEITQALFVDTLARSEIVFDDHVA